MGGLKELLTSSPKSPSPSRAVRSRKPLEPTSFAFSLLPRMTDRQAPDAPSRPSLSLLPRNSSQSLLAARSLARQHALDWLHVFVLVVILAALSQVRPVQRLVTSDDLKEVSRPLYPNTVPSVAVPALAVGVPILCFCWIYLARRDASDFHQGILGLLFSVTLAATITDSLKPAVGRPRPDFLWRCFPDGMPTFAADGNVLCTGPVALVDEGRRSFPSGHTSWSFAGLGFLSLFICGKLHTFSLLSRDLWRLIPPLLPLGLAVAVGVSRVDDYWHFPTDVLAGAVIGMAAACLCYFRLYPSLANESCHLPRVVSQGQSLRFEEDDAEAQLVERDGTS